MKKEFSLFSIQLLIALGNPGCTPSLGAVYLLTIIRLGLLAQLVFASPTLSIDTDFRESLVKKVGVDR